MDKVTCDLKKKKHKSTEFKLNRVNEIASLPAFVACAFVELASYAVAVAVNRQIIL